MAALGGGVGARLSRASNRVQADTGSVAYSGTAMLNRVVQRKGLDVGLMVNKGFEHVHSMGRAIRSAVIGESPPRASSMTARRA